MCHLDLLRDLTHVMAPKACQSKRAETFFRQSSSRILYSPCHDCDPFRASPPSFHRSPPNPGGLWAALVRRKVSNAVGDALT